MANKLNQQLNSLCHEIKPDTAWKERSREILLMQIRQGVVEKDAQWFTFVESIWMQKFLVQATRPLALVAMIIVAIFGGSVMSIRAANQTKPGDTLYIAKIISEKTRFALTFDNTQKAKLNLAFAANRANELKDLEESKKADDKDSAHQEKVQELTTEINAELSEASSRIAKLTPAAPAVPKAVEKAEVKKVETTKATDAVAVKVAPAVAEKDKTGIDYYDPRQAALEQAKSYIDKKDYDAAATQLNTLNDALEQPDKLEIKKSTSTVDKKSDIKVDRLEKGTSSTVEEVKK